MAFVFIPLIKGKPFINHKDGVRDNNELSNIEWCNNSENQKHSFEKLGRKPVYGMRGKLGKLCKNSKPLIQLDLCGNIIKEWDSTADVYRELKFTNISLACIAGVIRHGFKWQYT